MREPEDSAGGRSRRPTPHGRGATVNPSGRFERLRREPYDDGWETSDEPAPPLETRVTPDHPRTILTTNDSPDVPFDRSINPYQGCEHGCVYCYARPTHAYWGLSPGADFESRLFAKDGAADLLRKELARRGYEPRPIALGANTDPNQPVERDRRITRSVLEVAAECRHPVSVVTKSSLVLRDTDLLVPMAAEGLASVAISITTLDRALARRMEPRAAAPERRLETVRDLSASGVPVGVLVAPVIPGLTDVEMERIIARSAEAGAGWAAWILLRLPGEVGGLFTEWLETRYPDRAKKVLSRVRASRGGALTDPRFGSRMRGEGPEAALLAKRFALAVRRAGIADRGPRLDTTRFCVPEGWRPAAPVARERSIRLDLFETGGVSSVEADDGTG